MNKITLYYIKGCIRRLCYPYKYYLKKIEIVGDMIHFNLDTKDKHSHKIIIEGEFPLTGIVKNLHIYLKQLKASLDKNITEAADMEANMKYINKIKKQLNNE